MRLYLSPRVSIGPELTYVHDPGGERSLFLTGNVSIDLLRSRGGRPERVVPFVVAGGGFFRHTDPIGAQEFSHVEGAVTGGGGARIWLSKRIYAAAEGRIGWEPHIRITGTIGSSSPPRPELKSRSGAFVQPGPIGPGLLPATRHRDPVQLPSYPV